MNSLSPVLEVLVDLAIGLRLLDVAIEAGRQITKTLDRIRERRVERIEA